MTAALLEEFKQQIQRLELEPSRGGCFELTVNGELVYSKLETGEFPDTAPLLKTVRNFAT